MLRRYPERRRTSNVRDLKQDPIVAFQHKHYYVLAIGLNVLVPLALGWLHNDLWGVFLLAGVLRLVVSHHFTFLINSFAHAFGRQPYTDENSARDNGWLAFLTYGEGYHNFHHQFAHDYRNGIRWWHWDPSKWIICSLSWVGITKKLRRTPAVAISARASRCSSGGWRRASKQDVPAPRGPRAAPGDGCPGIRAVRRDLAQWSADRHIVQKTANSLQRWEEASFRSSRVLLAELRMQHRRLKLLGARLA
jgi:stearoyl-CoA desaturase (delta-9 desaturase)